MPHEWTGRQRHDMQRYLTVCRAVHRLLPADEAWPLLRRYNALARTSVAVVERAWAREKHRRGLA